MYLFHKADEVLLKMKAKAVLDKFNKCDINTNWCTIKSILNNLLDDYVCCRTTSSRHNLPWTTNEIKRSMRKRDRLFLQLGHQIQIPSGQILGNLGYLLLN